MTSQPIGDIKSWDSAIRSPLLEATLGNSYDFVAEALPLAPTLEATQLQTLWSVLSLASAVYSPSVTLQDPINGTSLPLTTAIVLIGSHGRWHDAVKRFVSSVAREVGINADSADTGGEKAGAVAMLRRRRAADESNPETDAIDPFHKRDTEKDGGETEALVNDLAELAAFDSSKLEAISAPRLPRTDIYHTPSELMAFLNPSRPELYHHIYSGLQQETLASSQKQASYFVRNVSLSLFATGTQETIQHLFPPTEVYLKHMARFNFVFTGVKAKWEWTRFGKVSPTEALEAIKTRLSRRSDPRTMHVDAEAFKYFVTHRNPQAIQLSRQYDAYQSIRPNHLLRIASIIALLRDPLTEWVNLNDMRLADLLLYGAEEKLQALYFAAYMGLNGRVLASLLTGLAQFRAQGYTMTFAHATAWLVTSGFQAKQAEESLDQLSRAKILTDSDHKTGIRTIFDDQEENLVTTLRRIGLVTRFSAFKD